MRKQEESTHSGIEDFAPKRNRDKWDEDSYRQEHGEKKRRILGRERFLTKKTLLWIAGLLLVILLIIILFQFIFTNDKDRADIQLYKVMKANTDRDYKMVGGKSIKGKTLWRQLGEIDKEKYETISIFGQQDFTDDVIAAANKAVSQESMKIGGRTYSTQNVSSDTLEEWINRIQSTEGAEHKLVAAFHADVQPAFIPPYDGLTAPKLGLIAVMLFVVICLFIPKTPKGIPFYSNQKGSISRLP